jgi:thiamine biosynthesis lipoprotein
MTRQGGAAGSPAAAGFEAIGTSNLILATVPSTLPAATRFALDHLADLDRAVSRFRDDSEVSRLARRARTGDVWWSASALFVEYLDAARRAAGLSDGLVDFTVGSAVIASGYDLDIELVRSRDPRRTVPRPAPVPGWRRVDAAAGRRVWVPRGTVLDFGASAKAHAADTIAAALAARFDGGFLVNLGGDIAVAGEAPDGGWRVGVETTAGAVRQVVAVTDQGVATSSTQRRSWPTAAGTVHHIVDPRTGATAPAVWAQVTCVAADALQANTASTAAIVLGEAAPAWLADRGVAARLDRPGGAVVLTPGWPAPPAEGVDR